jgi:rhodanese-related sulfurtransferase
MDSEGAQPPDRGERCALAVAPDEAGALLAERAILDVRDDAAFARGHLDRSGHVPADEFRARRAELPPRDRAILVVSHDGPSAARAAEALAALGFTRVAWLDGPLEGLAGGRASSAPAERLWRPAAFLEEVLPGLPRGRAIDLGAGSGRDAVFLAQAGFEVEAWDSDPEALRRARDLAGRHGVRLETVICDLEAPDPPLGESRYALIVCFRFLHRPLFPLIERALAPGGHLVYETFRLGQERFGKPRRPGFLLESGELAMAFPALEVLRYEEPDPPGGPWTARLLARRGERSWDAPAPCPPPTSTA